jgi:carbonic anhydrase
MKKFLAISFLFFLTACLKDWSYSGSTGSKYWGELKPEFKFCKIGYNQSPINIKNNEDYEFKDNELQFNYVNSDIEKEQKDYVQIVSFDGPSFLMRGKKKYNLRKIIFHTPSEHLIDGKPYPLELQIYHKSEDEQWLSVSIFFEVGNKNPEFERMISVFSGNKNQKFDLAKFVKSDDKNFFYDGSFTTPPCKEGVKWYVMKTPMKISKEQMNQIIKLAILTDSNARPAQEFHPDRF